MAYFSYMYIICSALLYKSYLSLPYVTSLWDSFYLKWTFANGFVMLPPSSLASLQGCLLAISLRFGSFLVFSELNWDWSIYIHNPYSWRFPGTHGFLTIYMGKLVGLWFTQMVCKIKNWEILRWNDTKKSCSIYFPTRFSGIFL